MVDVDVEVDVDVVELVSVAKNAVAEASRKTYQKTLSYCDFGGNYKVKREIFFTIL